MAKPKPRNGKKIAKPNVPFRISQDLLDYLAELVEELQSQLPSAFAGGITRAMVLEGLIEHYREALEAGEISLLDLFGPKVGNR